MMNPTSYVKTSWSIPRLSSIWVSKMLTVSVAKFQDNTQSTTIFMTARDNLLLGCVGPIIG